MISLEISDVHGNEKLENIFDDMNTKPFELIGLGLETLQLSGRRDLSDIGGFA